MEILSEPTTQSFSFVRETNGYTLKNSLFPPHACTLSP
uniref:Uncharacterized protein n=1 Tax=Rhizophora mucronata TaxID=61149 RepID=A0A2P2NPF9_RHIMU